MPTEIKRKLARQDLDSGWNLVDQDQIAALEGPVVVLGDPGLGKTFLTKALARQFGMKYVRAGSFARNQRPEALVAPTQQIVIDGLDEIASAVPGGAVVAVLRKLSAAGSPSFILSCREADWLGAADRIKIEDDYGVPPVVLHLQPFTSDDARTFLAQEFPRIDAEDLLAHLADRGIEALYGNPLTLRMLGEVAQTDGPLPDTRAQLLDRACLVMLEERNPRHHAKPRVLEDPSAILLTAGAASATQLLCDRLGICKGPYTNTPDGFLHASVIKSVPYGQGLHDALATRLFRAEGEDQFTLVHRVIAEFLGAKWLARCFEDGVSENRIFTLLRHGGGVPTSLRGLHAWVAHFSSALAGRCIAADPYAVLRYGDAETLSLSQARALLNALTQLSHEDPYFRSEDWGRHPASGLMRVELREEILSIVRKPRQHSQLADLLLEAIAGSTLTPEVMPELEAIMFDTAHTFVARVNAWEALREADGVSDRDAAIHRLLAMGDPRSLRVACHILDDVGMNTVSFKTGIDTVLGRLGFGRSTNAASLSGELRYPPDRLCRDLRASQIPRFLDELVARVKPSIDNAEHVSRADAADLIRHLVVKVLESDLTIKPARIWRWIGWVNGHLGYDLNTKKRLTEIFRDDLAVRVSLQEHVMLTPCTKNVWLAGHSLSDVDLGLHPNAEDIAEVLPALHTRTVGGPIDTNTWRDLLLLGRSAEGLPTRLQETATRIAAGDQGLLSILEQVSNPAEPEWKAERDRRDRARSDEQQEFLETHRSNLAAKSDKIAAGDIHTLLLPASVYVGHRFMPPAELAIDFDLSPEDRLRAFLGDSLSKHVLAGFIAVLERADLPSASQIIECHCESKHFYAEILMSAGVLALVRAGRPLHAVHRDTLWAVYASLQRMPGHGELSESGVDAALESELFRCEADQEAHFRRSIEPQLALNLDHVYELYRLTTDPQLSRLAGRLAVKWLRRFPTLGVSHQGDLLACAIDSAQPETICALVVERRASEQNDEDARLLWLSADYIVDFVDCREALTKEAAENPEFLWRIRDQVSPDRPDRNDRLARLGVAQLAFVVEAFASHWPSVDHPSGTVKMGNCNPSDAAEFIRNAIRAITGRPEPEATEALQRLVAEHDLTFADRLKHALALQRRARRDHEYAGPTVDQLRAVMIVGLPETIDDMRAWFLDRLENLQRRLRGSNTDMWEAYWGEKAPRHENFCRNRVIEHIAGLLPPSIRLEPEAAMPRRRRADIAVTRNQIRLPVEIKCQWHKDVWTAASNQLDSRYTPDWQAERCGVYIVLWFGNVPKKKLPRHPEGLERPKSPEELGRMLVNLLPEARRAHIDVFVLDVSQSDADV